MIDVTAQDSIIYVITVNENEVYVTTSSNLGQPAIQWQDEGEDLGTAGTVSKIDFVGAGVTAVRENEKVTVTIPGGGGGGGGGTWGSITGTLSDQTDLQTTLNSKWSLANGGTLTGVNTITSNDNDQLNFAGTWTAVGSGESHADFGGTFTNIPAGTSTVTGYLFNPLLNANGVGGNTHTQIALHVNPNFGAVGSASTVTHLPFRVSYNSNPVFTVSGGAATNDGVISIGNGTAPLVISRLTGNPGKVSITTAGGTFGSTDVGFQNTISSISRSGAGTLQGWNFNANSLALSGGVVNFNHIGIIAAINSTSTGEYRMINGSPNFTDWDGDVVGYNWNPTTPANIAGAHIAWRNTSGSVLIGHTALGASTTRLQVRGIGTTTGNLALFEDSSGNEKLKILDNGSLTLTQSAISSSWNPALTSNPGAHTGLTAATAFPNQVFSSATQSWVAVAGTIAAQKDTEFKSITHSAATSGTFTDLYNVFMESPAVGGAATATRRFALGLNDALQFTIGTTVSSNLDNTISISARDSSDGSTNATLALYCEQAVETIGTFTPSHKHKIWINGVEYWIQLDAV